MAGTREIPWGKGDSQETRTKVQSVWFLRSPRLGSHLDPAVHASKSSPLYLAGVFQLLLQADDQVGVGTVLLSQHPQISQGILDPEDKVCQ